MRILFALLSAALAAAEPGTGAFGLIKAAQATHARGNYAAAEKAYRTALAVAPDDVDAVFGLGNVLVKLERVPEALEQFERAAAMAPGNSVAQFALGLALADVGEAARAVEALSAALAAPDLPEHRRGQARVPLATALSKLGRMADAAELMVEHAGAAPDDDALQYGAGVALLQAGLADRAVDHLQLASDLRDGYKNNEALGQALWAAGRMEDAAAAFKAAMRIRPTYFWYYGPNARLVRVQGGSPAGSVEAVGEPTEVALEPELERPVTVTRLSDRLLDVLQVDGLLDEGECAAVSELMGAAQARHEGPPGLVCVDNVVAERELSPEERAAAERVTDEVTGRVRLCVAPADVPGLEERLGGWSSSVFVFRGESELLDRLEDRVEALTGLPASHAKSNQLLTYAPGGADYAAHTDCVGALAPGDRVATVLLYLNEVDEGGETEFPRLGVSVAPRCGRALVFTSTDAEGFCDPLSEHVARAVRGSAPKTVVQKWYTNKKSAAGGAASPFTFGTTLADRTLGEPYVLCDASGSCREYLPMARWGGLSEEEEGEGGAEAEL